ncbi:lectin C-type domain protein [Ostertagia ostertagi]
MLVFLAAFLALASADCPLGTVYHQEFNRCYKFVSTAQPFYLAEEACISIGGHVVSISSGYENAMLSESAQAQKIATFYTGLNTLSSNSWGWSDGSSANYTNWATGEPVDGNTCAVQNSKDSTWKSVSCNSAYAYYFLWSTFDNAEDVCMSNGGHLTSIHSDEENIFVADISKAGVEYKKEDDLTWIGLKQQNYPTSPDWTWTDGTPLDYIAWGSGQPADKKGREHCAQTHSDYLGRNPGQGQQLPTLGQFVHLSPNTIYIMLNLTDATSFPLMPCLLYMAEEACQSLGGHLVSFKKETASTTGRIGSPFWMVLQQTQGDAVELPPRWAATAASQTGRTRTSRHLLRIHAQCPLFLMAPGNLQHVLSLVHTCAPSPPSFLLSPAHHAHQLAVSQVGPILPRPIHYFLWASFENAENICKANGGHLASIHSLEENNFVATMGMSGITYTNDADLTKQLIRLAKTWSWTDGSKVDFLFWGPGQPDDAGGSEHCVEVFSDHTGKDPAKDGNYQRWNDMPCATNMRSYVCKKASLK